MKPDAAQSLSLPDSPENFGATVVNDSPFVTPAPAPAPAPPPPAPPKAASPPAAQKPFRPQAGMDVHRYQLIRELGRGGMGAVFLARDTRLGRLAAIKFLSLTKPELVQRFIAEARATAACSHENIVIIYDADEFRGLPYMALEYLEGRTLRALMQEHAAEAGGGPQSGRVGTGSLLSAERAISIAMPMLRALNRAHEMGIVHRDLKPENVMITNAGTVKVLDFGIAKVLDAGLLEHDDAEQSLSGASSEPLSRLTSAGQSLDELMAGAVGAGSAAGSAGSGGLGVSMTRTGALMGTLPYMSPEQLRSRPIDARTDIWATGIMLFEMVTGQHPLAPMSRAKLFEVVDESRPMPRLSALRPDLGPLARIIDQCLIKPVDGRMATASQLLVELRGAGGRRSEAIVNVDESPFNGLAAFQEDDADRFFGRSHDTAAVVARVRSHPLVAVVGPSGAGKSSLVRAGVIPALKQAGEGWEALIVRPGRTPLAALADLLTQLLLRSSTSNSTTGAGLVHSGPGPGVSGATISGELASVTGGGSLSLSGTDVGQASMVKSTVVARLRQEPGYLGAELRAWAQRKMRRVLVFVDQFEELFTLAVEPAEREAFLASLVGVADDASSPLRIIFSMRSDFIERLAETRDFMAVATRGLMLLPPIGRSGLREALVKPVEAINYKFESDRIVESMLDALESTSGALPLLQFTAAHLWDRRDRKRRLLTESSYVAMGGIAGALARHADAILAGMSGQRVTLTRRIFERLVTPERTRAIVSVDELRELASDSDGTSGDDIEQVLQELADARLVVIETGAGDGGGLVEVVHESLIASWPTLNRWLDENQDDAAFIARLRAASTQWVKSGEAPGMLWRGDTEDEARRWSVRYQGPLADRERRFLAAVFALADRSHRRKRILLITVIASLSLMVMAAVIGLLSIRKAERESKRQADIAQQQLQAFQREQAAKQQAVQERAAALTEVEMSREDLKAALAKERDSLAQAELDRKRAEEALVLAQVAKDRARREQQKAELAVEQAERANRELERRIKKLQKKTGRIRTTL